MLLHDYQERASGALLDRTMSFINHANKDKNVYLKAITGSGKTVMMAEFIQKVFEQYAGRNEVAVVWMSIGTGGLQEQSAESLKENLPDYVRQFDSESFRTVDRLEHNSLLVLNWEAVNNMTIEKDGTVVYNNRAMREGEKSSLPDLFEETRKRGTKIVMIIDEAHIGAEKLNAKDVQRTTIIKNEISPNIIVNVTATPKFSKEIHHANIIDVDTKDVIREGRIKKGVRIDDSMDTSDDISFVERVVRSAVSKHQHLKELYQQTGNHHIHPLGLIQIPNGSSGAVMRDRVENILDGLGYTYDKGNLAEAVDKNVNMDGIKQSDSPVAFVIAKQAISTGWDAPRAQILVKLRDTKSTTFDAQTLGRVLRMPNGLKDSNPTSDTFKFFTHDDLNFAYVYTDKNYTLDVSEYKNIYPDVQVIKDKYKDDVTSLELPRSIITKEKIMVSDKKLRHAMTHFINKAWANSDKDIHSLVMYLTAGEYTVDKLEDDDTVLDKQAHVMSDDDVEYQTIEFLSKVSGSYIDDYRLFMELRRALMTHYGDDFISVRRWILTNSSLVEAAVKELNRQQRAVVEAGAFVDKDVTYTPPETILINAKFDKEVFEKCAYTKQIVRNFGTERYFEAFLDTNVKVKWWMKNADSGDDGLSIDYIDPNDNQLRLFYPDYIVRFEDGSLGIYETKSEPDPYAKNTQAKQTVLMDYLMKLGHDVPFKVYGGIVYLKKDLRTDGYEIVKSSYNEPK